MLIRIDSCGECPVSTRWEGSQGRVVCCATDKTFGANTLPKSCPLREREVRGQLTESHILWTEGGEVGGS